MVWPLHGGRRGENRLADLKILFRIFKSAIELYFWWIHHMLTLEKFSLGVGDRFAHQAKAQLQACVMAAARGVTVIPVWNKSNREHAIVGSNPASVRAAADEAVRQAGWKQPYHVDADHINLGTVDRFIDASDFYTLDVAAAIGQAAEEERVEAFLERHAELLGTVSIPGIDQPFTIDREAIARIARKYLAAVADERIPVQTIAPKFTGRFNKGVDYVGNVVQFEKEFSEDLAVIASAIRQYGLPANLKLSVHSGSDKFSIYAPIRRALQKVGAGVHLKTAGTTWLEELIGLAEAGGDGLDLAKQVYAKAFKNRDALCQPYATVIDIDYAKLPEPAVVNGWSSEQFTSALRHDRKNPGFNPDLRQLLHVGFKVAAKMGDKYLKMLETCEPSISRNVTENLFERHIKPLFL